MTLPLYQHDVPKTMPDGGHRGLWYNRFFDRYDSNWIVPDTGKSDWIKDNAKKTGDSTALDAAAIRHLMLITALGGRGAVFKVDWHFATGLGLAHPVENGLAWHHTLGVPYLAGSAVKGLIRAWIEVWDESLTDEIKKQQRLDHWFGNNEQSGAFIFFDALPIQPVTLAADVMTPHMGKWYEKGGEIQNWHNEPEHVPADWHAPVPVPFLIAKQPKLLFGIAPRCAKFASELKDVFAALKSALEWLGAGAKTAVGYGVMQIDDKETTYLTEECHKLKMQEQDNTLTLEQRVLRDMRVAFEQECESNRKPDAGGAFMADIRRLLNDGIAWPDAERIALADLIKQVYDYNGWGNADKKRERKALVEKLRTGN
ncbi:type III-B CRISPR module RAMP protein Cmr6 [Thiospirillum jenense]|uniref:Type III-B CRISPR module RAMP protein Cmr6 n=1 Tax=Thiospirillum jenense TaxID=1653858 RepID=A0A839HDG9_9GAMM|nr:type III-B CRISPR module RAMP protein Cmr6 [Thiospirillum jenense]MBB1126681.1 type III-B CRISPR module RAMP protein Cmr6 [Thiospirillum jenense]